MTEYLVLSDHQVEGFYSCFEDACARAHFLAQMGHDTLACEVVYQG